MEAKEKAQELIEKYETLMAQNSWSLLDAKKCALIAVEEKYNGIIYVLGELKARGELSEKIYLKCLNDLSKERQAVKQELNH